MKGKFFITDDKNTVGTIQNVDGKLVITLYENMDIRKGGALSIHNNRTGLIKEIDLIELIVKACEDIM